MGVTAAHVLRLAKTDILTVGAVSTKVIHTWGPFDLAYFKVPQCVVTPLGRPDYGEAMLESQLAVRDCRVANLGDLSTVVFQCADLPGPGESGSPIFQDGRVIGMLSSINLNNCKGTIISSAVIEKGLK